MKVAPIDRFWLKVEPEPNTGCWIWVGCRRRRSYGAFWTGVYVAEPHRFIYAYERGPVSEGLELDHLCRNNWCVNPAHLEAVTHLENVRRGRGGINHRARVACPRGHPYDRVSRKKNGLLERRCSECQRRAIREFHARKRLARA